MFCLIFFFTIGSAFRYYNYDVKLVKYLHLKSRHEFYRGTTDCINHIFKDRDNEI